MLDIKADFRPLTRGLNELAKNQVPFATAVALKDMAHVAADSVTRQLPSIFDRPTPFTMKAISVEPRKANKRNPTARVFVKDRQAEYLALQETGGTRRPERSKHGGSGTGQALVMPKAVKRDKHGNIAFRGLARLKAQKTVFVGSTESGIGGFFRRLRNGELQPLAIFIRSAKYEPKFGFKDRVKKAALAEMAPAFTRALAKAIATARR